MCITLRSVNATKSSACTSYQKTSGGSKREGKQREFQDRSGEHLAEISAATAKSPLDALQFAVPASSNPAPAAPLIWGLLQAVTCSLQ